MGGCSRRCPHQRGGDCVERPQQPGRRRSRCASPAPVAAAQGGSGSSPQPDHPIRAPRSGDWQRKDTEKERIKKRLGRVRDEGERGVQKERDQEFHPDPISHSR